MAHRTMTTRFAGLLWAFVLLGASAAGAQTGFFPQVASASVLRVASGTLHDVTVLDGPPHWTLNGEWTLSCRPSLCPLAALEDILFDLSITMVRPDGTTSHVHSFSGFVAETVTLSPDGQDLTIDGTIVGSGSVGGPTDILITLDDVGSSGTFNLQLPGNAHLSDPLLGLILVSR